MEDSYNDVQEWKFKDLPAVFGAKDGEYRTYQMRTKNELDVLFRDEVFNAAGVLQFVEVHMEWNDAPRALKLTAELAARNNAKQ